MSMGADVYGLNVGRCKFPTIILRIFVDFIVQISCVVVRELSSSAWLMMASAIQMTKEWDSGGAPVVGLLSCKKLPDFWRLMSILGTGN
jgi:hypothetical protein